MLTQQEMNLLVPQRLAALEQEHDIRILLAVESGSRAWGLESPDSDFDVRFLYMHRPEYYLQLEQHRDVIEQPVDDTWDVSGWDLVKTLRLLYKSNPTLYEWFSSPIVYRKTDFCERIRPVLNEYFSPAHSIYHYTNTAQRTLKEHLSGDAVKPKKYFYVLRPILAAHWIQKNQTPPPVAFSELYETMLPPELRKVTDDLLNLKKNVPEKAVIAPIPELHQWFDHSIAALLSYMKEVPDDALPSWEPMNRFFLDELKRF